MSTLQARFPSLTLFSDLDWEAVSSEYERDYADLSFPEYLQQKAIDGDCPPYLFELAFYEMAHNELAGAQTPKASKEIILNPTALFLNFEYDVEAMLDEAQKGNVTLIEKEHVLTLFIDPEGQVCSLELSNDDLTVLQKLEEGETPSEEELKKSERLLEWGVILSP